MQYFEHYDVQEIAVIESRIKSLTGVKDYAIIIHDKDLLDSGELKKKHFHAVITFDNATTSSVVAKRLHVEEQYVNKIRTNTKNAMLYLVHRNDVGKYQYPPGDVRANFDYIKLVEWCPSRVRREEIAEKIAKWQIKEYNIFDYMSCDDYARNKNYYDKCFAFRIWLIKNMERNLECVYIQGASGVGKTTFAKMLAEWYWYHAYISSWGKNPLDDYKWEECIILDDLRDDVYTFAEMLKVSDNNTDSYVWCRFNNKSIAECKLLIITSVQDIHDFYKYETWEEQKQLFRRFKHFMIMQQDVISNYEYKDLLWDYIYCWDFENPVSKMFNNSEMRGNLFFNWIQERLKLKQAPLDESKL